MTERIVSEFGRIDILINNAALLGSLKRGPFEEIPPEEFEDALKVNVMGAFLVVRSCCTGYAKSRVGANYQHVI
jgi:3-oxoacyl-[acyl-carrier protein] reductase